jgi:arylsulfatase A-like enzyme
MPRCLVVQLAAAVLMLFVSREANAADRRQPNVVLIITDDQGWGDLGFHGNERIKTPHLDALARQSVVLKNFYVSPVCTPTRASLMTGRYNYRTGAVDTFRGRAMMHAEEVTLAEILGRAGYQAGIFGKWHLGDNYPLRARDQGFHEVLTLWGGGLTQAADPPESRGNHYLDPWLNHNGVQRRFDGYCSDIYTDAALDHIQKHRSAPFFVYLAFNCPHTPLQVRDEDYLPYKQMGLDDATAKIYGMVANIDQNIGRLLAKLDELKLADDTIVIFMTDNGPQQTRYNGKWRGLKGSVYEGGIHVPCFVRWPSRIPESHAIEQPAAHIDIFPTLLEACGVEKPQDVNFDGRSLLPLLERKAVEWPERNLFFQWHRGDKPELYRAFAARGPRYKLVQAAGVGEQAKPPFKFELFDLLEDPGEQHDLAVEKPDIVARMKAEYESWFRDVSATRGYDPPAIQIGTKHENPLRLSRQDLRGFGPREPGYWRVKFERGHYDVKMLFAKGTSATVNLAFETDNEVTRKSTTASEATLSFSVAKTGVGKLKTWIDRDGQIGEVQYVIFTRQKEQ